MLTKQERQERAGLAADRDYWQSKYLELQSVAMCWLQADEERTEQSTKLRELLC